MLPQDLDTTDIRILERLQQDARLTNVELAQAVHLSPSPCLARVRALEASGYIARYVTLLDPLRLGLTVSVFISVRLERQVEAALDRFEAAIADRPEVMECYLMTGDSDYLIRVVVSDVPALERFIVDFLSKIPGVGEVQDRAAPARAQAGRTASTQTHVVAKRRATLTRPLTRPTTAVPCRPPDSGGSRR